MWHADHEIGNLILHAWSCLQKLHAVSDTENIDEDEQILNDASAFLFRKIAGNIELLKTIRMRQPIAQRSRNILLNLNLVQVRV